MVSPKTSPAEAFLNLRDHTASWPSGFFSTCIGQTAAIYVRNPFPVQNAVVRAQILPSHPPPQAQSLTQ